MAKIVEEINEEADRNVTIYQILPSIDIPIFETIKLRVTNVLAIDLKSEKISKVS